MCLIEEVGVLSRSLQEEEATMAQLQSELESYRQVAGTPEQLMELLAELQRKLREAEDQKQQLELLHVQVGELKNKNK